MSGKVSQKDYLKKYLSSDKKKKKRKSKTISGQSVKIIDHDIDFSKLHQIADEDLEVYAIGEDAPTIVGILDERPPELIAKEDYKNNGKWKVIADDDGFTSSLNIQHTDRDGKVSRTAGNDSTKKTRKYDDNDDLSPPRVKHSKKDSSPKRTHEPAKYVDKPRRSRFTDASPPQPRRKSRSPDNSPLRFHAGVGRDAPSTHLPLKKVKQEPDSDESPPRRNNPGRMKNYADSSPPRSKVKQEADSDVSPPRIRNARKSHGRSDSDQSPPRKSNTSSAVTPLKRKVKEEPDSDVSPPRRRRSRSPRRLGSRHGYSQGFDKSNRNSYSTSNRDSVSSASRKNRPHSRSPFSHRKRSPHRRNSRSPKLSPRSHQRGNRSSPTETAIPKMMKTLDGKTAGLQNAKTLRMENDKFKEREEELYSKMSADVSGRHAEAVVRDRKTGRIRDLGEEAAKEHEKLLKEQERKVIYDKWGKGLKQVEDYRSRLESDLHEISKPLARYSDDKDLEEMLKKQERDGDPMLNYIRNKKETGSDAAPSKPIYRGAYPENRFTIRPGYRWDGVDRSNGYETKWFDVQSKVKAGEEEAYKYSTEDM